MMQINNNIIISITMIIIVHHDHGFNDADKLQTCCGLDPD